MAKVKVNTDKALRKLKELPRRIILANVAAQARKSILREIKEGRSPVSGKPRRFQKYSDSYKAAIKGDLMIRRTQGGGYIVTTTEREKKFKDLSKAFGGDTKLANRVFKDRKAFIKRNNPEVTAKKVSPVNLTLSGKMLRSFFTITKQSATVITVGFRSKIAAYHDQGQGSLPQRKLLPTRDGERFNRSILNDIQEAVLKALKK